MNNLNNLLAKSVNAEHVEAWTDRSPFYMLRANGCQTDLFNLFMHRP